MFPNSRYFDQHVIYQNHQNHQISCKKKYNYKNNFLKDIKNLILQQNKTHNKKLKKLKKQNNKKIK